MTKGEFLLEKAKCKHGHRSTMKNSAWCDLNKKCTVLKLHDMCHNPKHNCQKQITFTPKQFQLEGAGFKKNHEKIFKGNEKMWNNFIKPAFIIATPINSTGAAAQTKNLQSAQITSNIQKSKTVDKILSLTDMHAGGLRLKVM